MQVYNANYWEDSFQKNRVSPFEDKEKHNRKMTESAEYYAKNMKENPSYLEKIMMQFLDNNHIKYEFQKIYYIKKKQIIQRYFIVDFYIPHCNLVIEVDGKFHSNQIDYDNQRTKILKEHYSGLKIVRFTKDDFNDEKLGNLLLRLKASAYRKITKASKKAAKQKKKAEEDRRKKKIKESHT